MTQAVPTPVFDAMVSLRRRLHRRPELSWQEHHTADTVAAELKALGLAPRRVAKTGLMVDITGRDDGPIVALRADLDALPVQEATGLDFSSEVPGVMHACGHDGHTAMALGAAHLLLADPPPGPVRILFQPAEEHGNGAAAMVADGALEGVSRIFGGHVDRHYPVGSLVITQGTVNASTDTFRIAITGRGGHGGRPHEALDAVVIGSLLVTALQSIVSREVDPAHPSVVSVGSFHAGSAPNVIAGRALLEGTIRAHSQPVREHLCEAVKRVARAVGHVHLTEIEVSLLSGTPPVCNDATMTAIARAAAAKVVSADQILDLRTANMGGEDFSTYLEHVDGCYIRYGAQVPGRESHPAHSSRFDFHEQALGYGAAWMNAVARMP